MKKLFHKKRNSLSPQDEGAFSNRQPSPVPAHELMPRHYVHEKPLALDTNQEPRPGTGDMYPGASHGDHSNTTGHPPGPLRAAQRQQQPTLPVQHGTEPTLSEDFSRLKLYSERDSILRGNTIRQVPAENRHTPYHEAVADRNTAREFRDYEGRAEGNEDSNPYSNPISDTAESQRRYSPHSSGVIFDPKATHKLSEEDLARKSSIVRKEVGSGLSSTSTSAGHTQQSGLQKPLPADPIQLERTQRLGERHNQYEQGIRTQDLPGSISDPRVEHLTAQEVIKRANTDTRDTTVIEKIAPAVVHETITKDIHHEREEVITREIHNHDVYHRILPIIDVEVLPPRHFLPVEGGGLVEISADEVPGRGKNWVIAETASKIASEEAVPLRMNPFSAREFFDSEGDDKRYTTSEGFEKTEQTWIHPPELEIDGRETGQTWPMEFGESERKHGKRSSNKSSKRKAVDRRNVDV